MCDRRYRPVGFTLAEVMVTATLSLVLLGLVWSFLVPTFRAYARASARVEMQEQAALVITRMVADLQLCVPAGVGVLSGGPVVLSLQPAVGLNASGQTVWDDHLVVYSWTAPSGTVNRRGWPPSPPALALLLSSGNPCRPSPAQLTQLASQPGAAAATLASQVKSLQLAHTGVGAAVKPPLKITIVLERAVSSQDVERFELSRSISLRQAE